MFRLEYKDGENVKTAQNLYAENIMNVIKKEHLPEADIISITGPGKNSISLEKLRRLAEGRQAVPGQAIKTPRFLSVLITRTYMSEDEARKDGFTDESGCKSPYINILGKLLPNGRPMFAAAMR